MKGIQKGIQALIFARKEQNMTQADIAEQIGVSVRTIGRLEEIAKTGKGDVLVSTIFRYAAALGYDSVLTIKDSKDENERRVIYSAKND